MYYLLEDKRIINSETDEFLIHCREESKTDSDYACSAEELIEAHIGKISTYSENIFELIEVGDYVEVGERRWLFKIQEDEKGKYFYYDRFLRYYISNKNVYEYIQKIFKLNLEGDLKLVWKKGE